MNEISIIPDTVYEWLAVVITTEF